MVSSTGIRGKNNGPFTSAALFVILVTVVASCTAGVGAAESTKVIDACVLLNSSSSINKKREAIITTADTNGESATVLVRLVDCKIPNDLNITIVIPQRPVSFGNDSATTPHQETRVEIIETIMQGGSLRIVPSSSSSQLLHTSAHDPVSNDTLLQHVHIVVENSELSGTGDVLVVDGADTQALENVNIWIQNSHLTSTEGNVASFVNSREVRNTSLVISGNTTLQAAFLAASVETISLISSTLVADSSTGPMHLAAGGEDIIGHVGVLSIRPPHLVTPDPYSQTLYLEDVHLIVASTSNEESPTHDGQPYPIFMSSICKEGVASTVGIVLQQAHTLLTLEGTVSIDVRLHHRSEKASSENRKISFAPTTEDRLSPPLVSLKAHASSMAVAAVGSIALMTHQNKLATSTALSLHRCNLRLAFVADGFVRGAVVLNATVVEYGVSSIFGIAMYNYKHHHQPPGTLTVDIHNGSHVTIASSAANCNSITMTSNLNNSGACAMLGITVFSLSYGSGTTATTFTILDKSHLSVMAAFHQCGSIELISKGGLSIASATLGLSMRSSCGYGAITTLLVDRHSVVAFTTNASRCTMVSLVSATTQNQVASAVLGIAFFSYSYTYSNTPIVKIVDGSQVRSSLTALNCGRVLLDATSAGQAQQVASILGISMFCYSGIRDARPTLALVRESKIASLLSIRECSQVIVWAATTTYASTTVLGIAVLAVSSHTSAAPTFSISDSSNFTSVLSAVACGRITLQTIAKDHVAISISGAAVHSSSNAGDSSPATLALLNGSRIANAASTVQCGDVVVSSLSEDVVTAATFGIAVGSHLGKSNCIIGSTSTVAINALFTSHSNRTSVTTASNSVSSSNTLGISVRGSARPVLSVKDEATPGPAKQQTGENIHIWVGAVNRTALSTTVGRTSSAAVVGLRSKMFENIDSSNTHISYCSDGTVHPTVTTSGAVLGTEPNIPGITVNRTDSWEYHQLGHQEDAEPTSIVWCDRRAETLEQIINSSTTNDDTLPHHEWPLPYWVPFPSSVPSSTHTTTLAHSQSASLTTSGTPFDTSVTKTFTSTGTVTSSIIIAHSSPPPTVPTFPPPKQRTVKITTSILLPGNEQAATVVLSTAGASGAVGSTLGSGGGGMVVTAGSSVRMMECGLADDEPRPASFELPIQFAVGNGSTRYFAGASLAHTLLQCFFLAVPVLLRRVSKSGSRGSRNAVTYLSMLFCGAHAFFTPAILGACSTVLNNDDDGLSLAVAGCCVLVLVGVHGTVVLAVHRGPQNGLVARATHGHAVKFEFDVMTSTDTTSSSISATSFSSSDSSDDDTSSTDSRDSIASTRSRSYRRPSTSSLLFSGHATKDILLTLFDGCRIFEKASHRHYASIETTLYSIIAVISGARPKENCAVAAFAIGALAAVQLLYIVVIRPFRTRLDTIFSLLNALVLVVLSLAVAVSVQKRSSEDAAPDEWVLKTVEACLWLISVLGYTQLVLQGYWTYHVHQRRVYRERREAELRQVADINGDVPLNDDGSVDEDSLNDPLLVVMEMEERPTLTAPAPSDASEHDGVMNPLTKHRGLRK